MGLILDIFRTPHLGLLRIAELRALMRNYVLSRKGKVHLIERREHDHLTNS